VLNAILTGIGNALHVASSPYPRDSNTLAVILARVHALFEGGGGRDSVNVSTAVIVATLDLEVLVLLAVVVVLPSTGKCLGGLECRSWGDGTGTGGGDGAGEAPVPESESLAVQMELLATRLLAALLG
jgi:hypothetical protein